MAFDPAELASGMVVTGFGFPVVALYKNNGGTVSYTSGRDLARGVSVSPNIETANDDNVFAANNRAAESAKQRFRRGTADLKVDGLLRASEKMIMGIPETSSEDLTIGSGEDAPTIGVTDYDDGQNIPYVGLGYIVRAQSNGQELFFGVVYTKTRFAQFAVSAATEEEEIDWQTTDLSATLMRDDTAKHRWQRVTDVTDSELTAYNAVRVMLGMAPAEALPAT